MYLTIVTLALLGSSANSMLAVKGFPLSSTTVNISLNLARPGLLAEFSSSHVISVINSCDVVCGCVLVSAIVTVGFFVDVELLNNLSTLERSALSIVTFACPVYASPEAISELPMNFPPLIFKVPSVCELYFPA